jgi:hypothetical protein
VSAYEVDFGALPAWEPVTRKIVLRNIGGSMLQISEVTGSCGCTDTHLDSTSLAPHEETALQVTVRRTSFTGGRIYVTISSNDPLEPFAVITMLVKVPWEVIVSPRGININGLTREELPALRKVHVKTSARDDALAGDGGVRATSDCEYMQVRITPVHDNTEYEIEAVVERDAPAGMWRASIDLDDDVGLVRKKVEVAVSIRSTYLFPIAGYALCPNEQEEAATSDGKLQSASNTIAIAHRAEFAFTVDDISFDPLLGQWLSARVVESKDVLRTTIQIGYAAESVSAMWGTQGHMYLHLAGADDGPDEVFSVPLSVCASDL